MYRREFVALLPLLLAARTLPERARRIGIAIGAGTAGSAALKGIRFGVREAKRTAELLKRELEWPEQAGDAAIRALAHSDCELIIALGDAGAAVMGGPPVLRVPIAEADRSSCGGDEWHVGPAAEQRSAVLATYRTSHARAPRGLRATAWHGALEKYGAAQLNERYRAAVRAPMDEAAWLGWVAVKIALEAALRGNAAMQLRAPGFAIDGHKGTALAFDAAGRRLQQPLYVFDPARPSAPPLAEITPEPVAGVCTVAPAPPRR